ncbi:ABC transporter permease subunit [Deinococcus navajonensis]|uniref:ABC transporter permease subunit n=1 Tax=Deinococcus navajonensis TaxID=309884 RepID=A0ABV8XKD2_9DEIO
MNGRAIRAVIRKDLKMLQRSKPVLLPLILIPLLFFVLMPLAVGLGGPLLLRGGSAMTGMTDMLGQVSPALRAELTAHTPAQRPVVLLGLYLLAPIYLIVPIMVSSVIGADSFAGEKERRTFEALAYSPITDRELFLAKVAVAWVPAVLIALLGFVVYGVTLNVAAWPVMGRVFFPNVTWVLLALWVAPAVAALALGATVLVSARVQTFQEAFQLGGVVVLPLILLVVGQAAGVVYLGPALASVLGGVVWVLALALLTFGARSFQRTGMLARA